MRLGIKGKQVLGVTSIVGAVVVLLSLYFLSRLASVSLEESRARAVMLEKAIYQRARDVVSPDGDRLAVRADPGLRSILESSLYSDNVTFAAIVDTRGVAVAHVDPALEGTAMPAVEPLDSLLNKSALSQLAAIFSGQGRNLEVRQPLMLDGRDYGSIRIGVSTLLIRNELNRSLGPAVATAGAALAIAVFVASLLSQLLLRPIHVIRS